MPSSQEHNTANPRSYDPISMSLHWLTALLVLAAFIMGPGGSEQRVYSAAKDFEREIHEVLGLAVFVLALLRLGWKPFARTPQRPELPGWMTLAAQVVQGLLYVLLIATPITAVLGAWLAGHPLTLGILGTVPPMLPEARGTGVLIAEIHTILGDAVIWLAGLHAAAALAHHFLLADGVLLSMLPSGRTQRR